MQLFLSYYLSSFTRPKLGLLRASIHDAISGCKSLESLLVSGTIDASLLWPDPPAALCEKPLWQNLRHLYIRFKMPTPTGGWYFQFPAHTTPIESPSPVPSDTKLPPGYGSSEEEDIAAALQYSHKENAIMRGLSLIPGPDNYRYSADDEKLSPLVDAFAKACTQMPSLRDASLTSWAVKKFKYPSGYYTVKGTRWGIWFAVPGVAVDVDDSELRNDPDFSSNCMCRRLILQLNLWEPRMDISPRLNDIGRDRYGDKLVVRNLDIQDEY